VRLGLSLPAGAEAEAARLAEAHGLFGVFAGGGDPRALIIAATYAATATEFVRVVVLVTLGLEHPVTMAEELSILDNVCNGRTVALLDTGQLDEAAAADELDVIREALACRPVQHDGPRWKVPARLPANETATDSIMVTPKPAQIEVPMWLTGEGANALGRSTGLPVLARQPGDATRPRFVQPALTSITGVLEDDLETVTRWASTGTTHLVLELPTATPMADALTMVSRHLQPEVGMPSYPRVVSNVPVPMPWPGAR
jgi:alkanesulfonate monooxygenase SsuD/methylene tetrahydromethanopterin reductase-like flavin-dependent oxidoreductase (luciferase family)